MQNHYHGDSVEKCKTQFADNHPNYEFLCDKSLNNLWDKKDDSKALAEELIVCGVRWLKNTLNSNYNLASLKELVNLLNKYPDIAKILRDYDIKVVWLFSGENAVCNLISFVNAFKEADPNIVEQFLLHHSHSPFKTISDECFEKADFEKLNYVRHNFDILYLNEFKFVVNRYKDIKSLAASFEPALTIQELLTRISPNYKNNTLFLLAYKKFMKSINNVDLLANNLSDGIKLVKTHGYDIAMFALFYKALLGENDFNAIVLKHATNLQQLSLESFRFHPSMLTPFLVPAHKWQQELANSSLPLEEVLTPEKVLTLVKLYGVVEDGSLAFDLIVNNYDLALVLLNHPNGLKSFERYVLNIDAAVTLLKDKSCQVIEVLLQHLQNEETTQVPYKHNCFRLLLKFARNEPFEFFLDTVGEDHELAKKILCNLDKINKKLTDDCFLTNNESKLQIFIKNYKKSNEQFELFLQNYNNQHSNGPNSCSSCNIDFEVYLFAIFLILSIVNACFLLLHIQSVYVAMMIALAGPISIAVASNIVKPKIDNCDQHTPEEKQSFSPP